jgi:hypothetical protein
MKKQYKVLLWTVLIVSLSYLYQDYKKQKEQIQIAPSLQVKDQEQLIVKKKTQKLPTPNVSYYLEVGK